MQKYNARMKKAVLFFILFISVFEVYGASDSTKVVFWTLNETHYYPAHDNDAKSTDNSGDSIVLSANLRNFDYTASSSDLMPEMGGGTALSDNCIHGHYSGNVADSALTEGNNGVSVDNTDATSIQPLHRLAVKSNMLYDAALLLNVEVEWRFNSKWSVALEGGTAWWGKYSSNKSYRLAMVSPEVKSWFRPRGPWHGIYIGAFAGAGLYDLDKGSPGYRGEGVMGGLSVGYMWPISSCLSLEAAIGGGYLYTRYKEYIPQDGHHVYQRTKDLNYFGPLKVKLSLVWRLWDVNKRGNAKNQSVARYGK